MKQSDDLRGPDRTRALRGSAIGLPYEYLAEDQVRQVRDRPDREDFDRGRRVEQGKISRGEDAAAEAEGGRLAHAHGGRCDRAGFAAEAQLADQDRRAEDRMIAEGRQDGGDDPEVGGRFVDLHPAGGVDVDVAPQEVTPEPLL